MPVAEISKAKTLARRALEPQYIPVRTMALTLSVNLPLVWWRIS